MGSCRYWKYGWSLSRWCQDSCLVDHEKIKSNDVLWWAYFQWFFRNGCSGSPCQQSLNWLKNGQKNYELWRKTRKFWPNCLNHKQLNCSGDSENQWGITLNKRKSKIKKQKRRIKMKKGKYYIFRNFDKLKLI